MNAWVLVGFGLNLAMLFMAAAWAICRRLNNASFIDVAWAYGFALVVWLYVVIAPGDPVRQGFIAGMVTIWSLRLGTHLLVRVARRHPREDPRYAALREQFPQRTWFMFFGFFALQALLIGLLSAPFAVACTNPAPGINLWEIGGVLLWGLAFGGETLADLQLKQFHANPANKGKVCNIGLWRYSRHPNYFFEWVIWIAFFVFAVGSPWGWATFFCPLIMLHFLLNVTGVPPVEEQSLKSRGDAYRAYQRVTSKFIPRPPKAS